MLLTLIDTLFEKISVLILSILSTLPSSDYIVYPCTDDIFCFGGKRARCSFYYLCPFVLSGEIISLAPCFSMAWDISIVFWVYDARKFHMSSFTNVDAFSELNSFSVSRSAILKVLESHSLLMLLSSRPIAIGWWTALTTGTSQTAFLTHLGPSKLISLLSVDLNDVQTCATATILTHSTYTWGLREITTHNKPEKLTECRRSKCDMVGHITLYFLQSGGAHSRCAYCKYDFHKSPRCSRAFSAAKTTFPTSWNAFSALFCQFWMTRRLGFHPTDRRGRVILVLHTSSVPSILMWYFTKFCNFEHLKSTKIFSWFYLFFGYHVRRI